MVLHKWLIFQLEMRTLYISFTNRPSLIQYCYAAPGISDHDIVLTSMETKTVVQSSSSFKVYLWNQMDLTNLKESMANFAEEFAHKYSIDTPVDQLWCILRNELLSSLDRFVPSKMRKNNSHHLWLTQYIKRLRRRKQASYNRARLTNSSSHWQHFKYLKRTMQRECRRAFNKYMHKTIHKPYESGKKSFCFVKSLRSDYCGVSTLQQNGISYSNNQSKADLLNSQFSSVFTKDYSSPLPDMDLGLYPDISNFVVSTSGVTKILQELDPLKSPGPDKIPSRLLKSIAMEVSPWLTLLFSASLHQGRVPSDWKKALVCPVFKKGDRKNPSNYRLVSLTCICSKVMEHIIYSEIMSHLETHNILSDMQFGFRKRCSAELQLLQTIHDLAFGLNCKSQTDIILLDFSKAFDRVLHHHLITKLEYYGIRNNILNWIASFLSGCTQQVVCGGCYSSSTKVLSGVPQGSVLGPLLFLTYINDISHCVDSTCRLRICR